ALKKVLVQYNIPPLHIQKKIFAYIKTPLHMPGSSNYRIRSWLASLSRSILIRWGSISFSFTSRQPPAAAYVGDGRLRAFYSFFVGATRA
ncbi:MAG TPA: hypothetical protein VJZ49_10125, partial [Syntrophales bacterium]|nr:hypothetical protein [Syntrophales bacterium]